MNLNLGYACINTELRARDVFCSRTMRKSSIEKFGGVKKLRELCLNNLRDLYTILQWNVRHDIYFFRVSSNIFPFYGVYDYSINTQEFTDLYTTISKYVKDNGIRISFHPGQYTLLTSENTEVTRRSIQDIRLHAYLLNKMGTKDSVIVLHGGGVYKNKQKAIERFKKNYSIIPESARQYIVLENCENCYNISDLYEIGVSVYPQIPIVIDFHHHHINPIENISELYTKIHKVWENRGIKPKFHMSNSVHGAQGNDRRKHSDIITYFYTDFKVVYDIYNLLTNGASMDLMLECKHKEQAIYFLRA